MDNTDDNSFLMNSLQSIMDLFQKQQDKFNDIIHNQKNKIDELTNQNNLLIEENQKCKLMIKQLQNKLTAALSTLSPKDENGDFGLSNTNINNYTVGTNALHLNNISGNNLFKNTSFKSNNSFYKANSNKFTPANQSINNNINNSHINLTTNGDEFVKPRIGLNNSNISNPLLTERNKPNPSPSHSILSYKTYKTDVSKYDMIRQNITQMRNNSAFSHKQATKIRNNKYEEYLDNEGEKEDLFKKNDINRIEGSYCNNHKTEKKSYQFQKTVKFLNECKQNISASSYEQLVKLLKQNDSSSSYPVETKKKIYDLIRDYPKLRTMFDTINF